MARVLIVDDDVACLGLVGAVLRDAGHEALFVSDARQLLSQPLPPAIDAVILDLAMPEVSGWQVLEILRGHSRTRGVPVLLLSAARDIKTRVRGLRSGADDFLSKPFAPEELLARLESVLRRRYSASVRLQGDLAESSLPQVLQNLAQLRRSADLEVITRHGVGWIKVREGDLIEAEFEHWREEEALYALFEQSRGTFRLTEPDLADETKPTPGGRRAIDSFLLNSAWVEDELAARESLVPPLDAALHWVRTPPPAPEGFDNLGVTELAEAVRSGAARSFAEWMPRSRWAPRRALLGLCWLLEQGAIALAGVAGGPPRTSQQWSKEASGSEIDRISAAVDAALSERAAAGQALGAPGSRDALGRRSTAVRLDPLRLAVWIEPASEGEARALLRDLRAQAVPLATSAPGRQRAGEVSESHHFWLEHPLGALQIALAWGPSEWGLERDPFAQPLALLAYWGSRAARSMREPILRYLEERAPLTTRLVLIGSGESAPGWARWRSVASPPESISALLDLVLPD